MLFFCKCAKENAGVKERATFRNGSLSRFFYIKAISCSNCPSGGEHEREREREREFVALVATFSDELPK